jgi:hypothetical protein
MWPYRTACYECLRQSSPPRIASHGLVPTAVDQPWAGSSLYTEAFAAIVARTAVFTLAEEKVSLRNPDHVVLRFGGVAPVARVQPNRRDRKCEACGD